MQGNLEILGNKMGRHNKPLFNRNDISVFWKNSHQKNATAASNKCEKSLSDDTVFYTCYTGISATSNFWWCKFPFVASLSTGLWMISFWLKIYLKNWFSSFYFITFEVKWELRFCPLLKVSFEN